MYEMYDDRPYNPSELASRPKRYLGQVLDNILPVTAIAIIFSIATIVSTEKLSSTFGIAGFIVYFLYILFADGMNEGQSWGKKIVGVRVIDMRTGEPCSYWQSFVRNIFYILGIFDWIFIFGEKRQRLGDIAAKTVVIEV